MAFFNFNQNYKTYEKVNSNADAGRDGFIILLLS